MDKLKSWWKARDPKVRIALCVVGAIIAWQLASRIVG